MQGEQVEVEVYNPQNGDWAGSVDLEVGGLMRCGNSRLTPHFSYQVGFNNKKTVTSETYDTEELSHVFINASPRPFKLPCFHSLIPYLSCYESGLLQSPSYAPAEYRVRLQRPSHEGDRAFSIHARRHRRGYHGYHHGGNRNPMVQGSRECHQAEEFQ